MNSKLKVMSALVGTVVACGAARATRNQRTAPPRVSITENISGPTCVASPRRGTWPRVASTGS